MIVYALYIVEPDTFSYDGTEDHVEAIYADEATAMKAGEEKVQGYVVPSSIDFYVEPFEVIE